MKIDPIKTKRVTAKDRSIFQILDESITALEDGSIVAITSKIISICEGRVKHKNSVDKDDLIINESDRYISKNLSKYGFYFTITNNRLIPTAGIDESNGNGYYVLWPKNPQSTANKIREHLAKKHNLKRLGVVITDSTCQPLTWGTTGIAIAHSGFCALKNYIGTKDLFYRKLKVTQANISGGIASAAVLAMGEGAEQTPICIVSDAPFIKFQDRNPTVKELSSLAIDPAEDLFAPFIMAVKWKTGRNETRSRL